MYTKVKKVSFTVEWVDSCRPYSGHVRDSNKGILVSLLLYKSRNVKNYPYRAFRHVFKCRFLVKLHFVVIIMWALIYSHNWNSDAFI